MEFIRRSVGVGALGQDSPQRILEGVVVDPDVMYNWLPSEVLVAAEIKPERIDEFVARDGQIVERRIGFALLYVEGRSTITVVVFGEAGDRTLLGAHALTGLSLRVDAASNSLVDSGPHPAAAAA